MNNNICNVKSLTGTSVDTFVSLPNVPGDTGRGTVLRGPDAVVLLLDRLEACPTDL